MAFSKIRIATSRLIGSCFSGDCESSPEGGFIREVHIYSERNRKIIWSGRALLDPGNDGPNLVIEEASQYVHGQPTGPGMTIVAFDGQQQTTAGEVELRFSGSGTRCCCYRERFHQVPRLANDIDMVLNREFYMREFPGASNSAIVPEKV